MSRISIIAFEKHVALGDTTLQMCSGDGVSREIREEETFGEWLGKRKSMRFVDN